ncbi:hypothetical protein DFJ74DRAFT_697443 [Hyaloraphidium curvatum]|nr:hypothetical protein DFJ74DRAFT_697443 [Hyaloraphidium curvatum]
MPIAPNAPPRRAEPPARPAPPPADPPARLPPARRAPSSPLAPAAARPPFARRRVRFCQTVTVAATFAAEDYERGYSAEEGLRIMREGVRALEMERREREAWAAFEEVERPGSGSIPAGVPLVNPGDKAPAAPQPPPGDAGTVRWPDLRASWKGPWWFRPARTRKDVVVA